MIGLLKRMNGDWPACLALAAVFDFGSGGGFNQFSLRLGSLVFRHAVGASVAIGMELSHVVFRRGAADVRDILTVMVTVIVRRSAADAD